MPRKPKDQNVAEIRTFNADLAKMVEQAGFKFPDDGIVVLDGTRTKVSYAALQRLSEAFGYFGKAGPKKVVDDRIAFLDRKKAPPAKPAPKAGEKRTYKATAIGEGGSRRNALISVGFLFGANAPKEAEVVASYEKDRIIITRK